MNPVLIDIGISGATGALIAAGSLFLVMVALAYIIFRMLRKTVKMAFRMAVVAAVLLIGVVGSVSLYWFGTGSGSSVKPKPAPSRQR